MSVTAIVGHVAFLGWRCPARIGRGVLHWSDAPKRMSRPALPAASQQEKHRPAVDEEEVMIIVVARLVFEAQENRDKAVEVSPRSSARRGTKRKGA